MAARSLLKRIEVNPRVMAGKPVIRGTRITVELILELLAAGASTEEILEGYPDLSKEDVRAALEYARASVRMEEVGGLVVRG